MEKSTFISIFYLSKCFLEVLSR